MFCPQCGSEYRSGFYRCADCDVALVERLDSEPQDEIEAASGLSRMAETSSPAELDEIVARVEGEGIPYVIEAGTAIRLLDGDELRRGEPDVWEARLYVPAARADEARALWEELQREIKTGRVRSHQRPVELDGD